MKTYKATYFLIYFTCAFLCFPNSIKSQSGVDITASIGFPEGLVAGVNVLLVDNLQVGFSGGYNFSRPETFYSLSGDVQHHFGGHTKLSERKPWYYNVGLIYFLDESFSRNNYSVYTYKNLMANARVGREINITERFGMDINLGIVVLLLKETTVVNPPPPCTGWFCGASFIDPPLFPALSLGFFFKI